IPLTATIQKKKKPSAPSCASGLSAGPNRRSNGCSISIKPVRSALRTAPIISSNRFWSGGSFPGRTNPLSQDQSGHGQQGKGGDYGSKQETEIDTVPARAGIVGCADELDAIDDSAEGERRGRAVDDILHWFHEHRQRKVVAIDVAVDPAIALENRGLRRMVKTTGDRAIAEAEIVQQGFDCCGVATGNPPIRKFDALDRCELGHSRDRVVACIESDRQHREAIRAKHPSRLGHGVDQMLGGRRANGTASRIHEADYERLAAILPQRE